MAETVLRLQSPELQQHVPAVVAVGKMGQVARQEPVGLAVVVMEARV
jgi:hypothetical protein